MEYIKNWYKTISKNKKYFASILVALFSAIMLWILIFIGIINVITIFFFVIGIISSLIAVHHLM